MKAIILAGGDSALLRPLSSLCRRPLLPFLNRPFIQAQVRALAANGFREIAVACSPVDQPALEREFGDGSRLDVALTMAWDVLPLGPAGSLRPFKDFIGGDSFLVVGGGTWIGSGAIRTFFEAHHASDAVASMAMLKDYVPATHREAPVFGVDGAIERFDLPYAGPEPAEAQRFCGIYAFKPEIFQFIPADGYWDIKEQLLPALHDAGKPVRPVELDGMSGCVDNIAGYFQLQHDVLDQLDAAPDNCTEITEGVWLADGADVSPSARILGPVIIGKKCVVEAHAQIIGPAVIGDYSRVEEAALVRESFLWSESHVSRRARLEYCIVAGGHRVPPEARHKRVVLCGSREPVHYGPPRSELPRQYRPAGHAAATKPISLTIKRIVDVFASASLLLLLAPVLLVVAIAVRLDSRGPIFFTQRRCGRGGREFKMVKFRTMVPDAERLQATLRDRNDVDGPVFKIFDDPRVTTVGAFLRRNSLDELPQLWNVLKGEMSLVGPRPLKMSEMRLCPSWRDLRLCVKPGITGIWQINGRSHTSFHDWIRHDVRYVNEWSLWLDFQVLARTTRWVLARTGAC